MKIASLPLILASFISGSPFFTPPAFAKSYCEYASKDLNALVVECRKYSEPRKSNPGAVIGIRTGDETFQCVQIEKSGALPTKDIHGKEIKLGERNAVWNLDDHKIGFFNFNPDRGAQDTCKAVNGIPQKSKSADDTNCRETLYSRVLIDNDYSDCDIYARDGNLKALVNPGDQAAALKREKSLKAALGYPSTGIISNNGARAAPSTATNTSKNLGSSGVGAESAPSAHENTGSNTRDPNSAK